LHETVVLQHGVFEKVWCVVTCFIDPVKQACNQLFQNPILDGVLILILTDTG
jgi:hypothetical protein